MAAKKIVKVVGPESGDFGIYKVYFEGREKPFQTTNLTLKRLLLENKLTKLGVPDYIIDKYKEAVVKETTDDYEEIEGF